MTDYPDVRGIHDPGPGDVLRIWPQQMGRALRVLDHEVEITDLLPDDFAQKVARNAHVTMIERHNRLLMENALGVGEHVPVDLDARGYYFASTPTHHPQSWMERHYLKLDVS